jgi:phage head maturation protease
MNMNRAYSVFEVKSVDEEQRTVRGIATTPTPDRVKDVVEPLGAKFADDLPLFKHHDSRLIVGRTAFGKPTSKGIPFEARLPKIAEAGTLRDRVDEAWQEVKYRLVTGVSIGFKPVMDKVEQLKNGGLRFLEYEILELSLVPVPMNAQAVITQFRDSDGGDEARRALLTAIKSADQAIRRAASGAPAGGRVVRLEPAGPAGIPGASGQQQRRKGVVYLN